MADDLYQLSDDAVLLLYLADELSAGQRAQVEKRLVTDASFRATCESLRILNGEMRRWVGADSAAIASTELSDEMTVRRVVRELNRRRLELAAHPAPSVAARRRVYPAWIYPLGAAAAAVFIALGLWGVGVIEYNPTVPAVVENQDMIDHNERELAAALQVNEALTAMDEAEEPLTEAEQHLAELQDVDDLVDRMDLSL